MNTRATDAGALAQENRVPTWSPVYVYRAWGRAFLCVLVVWRWLGVWLTSGLVLWATDPPITPPLLVRLCALFVVFPWVSELALRWWWRARSYAVDGQLVLDCRRIRLEIPYARIAGAIPWRLPLPGPGLKVLFVDGTALRERIELHDPQAWSSEYGVTLAGSNSPFCRGTVAFAHARQAQPPWHWYHYAVKFGVFALLPAGLLFQVHQHIAYGGLWGEYYLRGPWSYVRTWLVYYGTVVVYLALFAGLLRTLAEGLSWLAASWRPEVALPWRQRAELGCALAYYAGTLLVLGVRFGSQ